METKKGYPKRRDEIEQIMEGKERKRKKGERKRRKKERKGKGKLRNKE